MQQQYYRYRRAGPGDSAQIRIRRRQANSRRPADRDRPTAVRTGRQIGLRILGSSRAKGSKSGPAVALANMIQALARSFWPGPGRR